MVIGSVRRIVGNGLSMLLSDVVSRATTFVLYALVARHLSATVFGQMTLALTLYYTFQVLAVAGLKTLITREVARDKSRTDDYLINGTVAVTVFSLLAILALLLFVQLMNYSVDTSSTILLLSLGLLPYSLAAICEAVFQAWEQMHYIAYANVPVNIAKIGLAFLILSRGHGLRQLIILLLVAQVAVVVLDWWLMLRHVTRPRIRIDLHFSLTMTRLTRTFVGIDVTIALWSSLNILMLSKLGNETEVGLYGAASQLMVPLTLVYQSVILSIFPMMCKEFEPSLQGLKRICEHLVSLLLIIALPMVIGLFFLADAALELLYGPSAFTLASEALRVMVWTLILIALTGAFGQVLLASLREKVTLRIVTIDALVSLVFGLILISQFGLIGAALTALLTRVVDFVQHYVLVSRLLGNLELGRLAWKPAVSGTCMAVYLTTIRDQGLFLSIVSAGGVYVGSWLVLTVWSLGGPRQLKLRYLHLWSK